MKMKKFDTVDEYINSFDSKEKEILLLFRKKIKELAPDSVENISYGMPGYKLEGKPLVYFAAFKEHIGFFPTPSGIEAFDEETKPYRNGKGTLQFKIDAPIPWGLVEKIIEFRVEQATDKF